MDNMKRTVEEAINELSIDSGDFAHLYHHTLYNVINDQLNEPVNTCEDLMKNRNRNIPMDLINDWADALDGLITEVEDVKKAILTTYFTVVALDTIVKKGKEAHKVFTTKHHGNYELAEVGIWEFKELFDRHKPLFLCLKNKENNSKVDINIGLEVSPNFGWLNWPMRVSIVDEDNSRTVSCNFITCLEDIKFVNIQRALNLVRE